MPDRQLPDHPLLRIKEVAAYFNVSVKTVYGWKDSGKIGYKKFGGVVFIPHAEVIEFERQGDEYYIPVKTF